MKTVTLEFKWTVSRGRDTAGYNVCTLYADGRKVSRCNGGGYDMKGTCLGTFIEQAYADRLRELKPRDMPKQSHWQSEDKRICDGKCKQEFNKAMMEAIEKDVIENMQMEKLDRDCWECPKCGGPTRGSNDGKRIDEGRYFYGLTFHDPNYDPGKATVDHSDGVFTKTDDEGKTVAQLESENKSFGLERLRAAYSASSKHATKNHTIPSIDGACGISSVEQIAKAIGLSFEYIPVKSKKMDLYRLHDHREELEAVA